MNDSHRKFARKPDRGVDLGRAVQQGYRDVERGVQDTSRAPEADQAYRALKRKAARVSPRGGRRNTP